MGQYELVHVHVKMDKHILIFVLATATTVLGQRDLYRPAAGPPVAQERAIYDYTDYEDYSPQPAAAEISTSGERGRLPPKQPGPSVNSYYQTDCKARERTLPHEKYCDHFYQLNGCSGNDDQAILRACPNGLTYTGNGRSGLIGVCDYPHRAECVGSERHNPPIATDHCDWLYGIFGHETSCTRYWTCWNGTATEQFCNRYWACQGGYPRLQRCPAMLVFDKY